MARRQHWLAASGDAHMRTFGNFCMLVAIVASCGPVAPTPVAPVSTVAPTNSDMCVAAKDNLLRLGCTDEGRLLGGPTKKGVPFDELCHDLVGKGTLRANQAACIATVGSCADVDPCMER